MINIDRKEKVDGSDFNFFQLHCLCLFNRKSKLNAHFAFSSVIVSGCCTVYLLFWLFKLFVLKYSLVDFESLGQLLGTKSKNLNNHG